MKIVAIYCFGNAEEQIPKYEAQLKEIIVCINSIDANKHKTKESKSQSKKNKGKFHYSPTEINKEFLELFKGKGWTSKVRIDCKYESKYYVDGFKPNEISGTYREMDFIKDKVGIEIQFGKYAFAVFNVCAKMTIFGPLRFKLINFGVEIVVVKEFQNEMADGVTFFEQFVWDLEHRGLSNIDTPVLILGISHGNEKQEFSDLFSKRLSS